jgi:hypothetical protein
MKLLKITASLALIALAACVENEEEITIRPDGSAHVRVAAKGKADDLADGYGVPLAAPWTATNDETLEWMRVLGQDTGSTAVRANLARLDASHGAITSDREMKLEVHADFASVKDWPRWFAPESEVYRNAYLERSASLTVESKSGRKIYTFERVFHARELERFDLGEWIKRNVSHEIIAKLEQKQAMSPDERAKLVDGAVQGVISTSRAFASDALATTFTSGDGSIASAQVLRVLEHVRSAVAALATPQRISDVLAWELDHDSSAQHDAQPERSSARELERDIRTVLRSSLGSALASEGIAASIQNAIRGELEWRLTAYDATCDLGDESFKITVHMPGVIVGGNSASSEAGNAVWEFKGTDLQDRERVMRVVSVVE